MSDRDSFPDSITLEFLNASGQPVRLMDLGPAFLQGNGLPATDTVSPFRIAILKRCSKAGNAFYDYSQNAVPLPDGLSTYLRVEGVVIPMGRIRPSQSGHPTRDGSAQIVIGGVVYTVTAYLTEGRTPFYVKVIAHRTPERRGSIAKAQLAPKGGRIIV